MLMLSKYIILFAIVSRVVFCYECIKEINSDYISVLKGIKLRRQLPITNNETALEMIGKVVKSDELSKEISLYNLMNNFLNSHVLEFNLSTLFQEEAELPRRRRHHQGFQMILVGIVIFLMFFVTLGFQLLATFTGKAFLMAKLAFLLASINGLRRIASSGVHYGLYHSPDPNIYSYDRFDRPRKLS